MEYFRFALTAVLLVLAIFAMASSVIGSIQFGFIMNRLHAAGIGDTMALLFAAVAAAVGTGNFIIALKIFTVVLFMWFTSPVATHFLGQIEYYMNNHLNKYMRREDGHDDSGNL